MTRNKKIIIATAVVLVAAILLGVYMIFGKKADEGMKNITLTVVNANGESVSYNVSTDGEYLSDAMEDAKKEGFTYSGEKGEYGLTIYEINGEKTDFSTSYWCVYVDGEMGMYGADSQPLTDGTEYSFVYTKI